jgi:FkbM family methyltransferase
MTTVNRPTGETQSLNDLVLLQGRQLLEQGRLIDTDSKDARLKSRDRLQGFFEGLQTVLKPELTLEIGAHAAPFSQRMSRQGITAHAFEANPYNHAAFAGRLKRRAPKVSYHHLALSDSDGEVTFQVLESRGGKTLKKIAGNNSLLQRNNPAFTYESLTVPSMRLDSFLATNGLEGRSFSAWIDVEGALGKVTAGFGAALRSCLSLIVEVEDASYWQGQMLVHDAMRYFAGQGLVPVARDFEALHQYNLVYLREDILALPGVQAATSTYLQGL